MIFDQKLHGLDTKVLATQWSKGIAVITSETKAQVSFFYEILLIFKHKFLSNMNSQKEAGPGTAGNGGGGVLLDYFDQMYERLNKEIEILMLSAK